MIEYQNVVLRYPDKDILTDVKKVLGHPASSLLDTLRDRKLSEEKHD